MADKLKALLISANRCEFARYANRSLDAEIYDSSGKFYNLYAMISGTSDFKALETKMLNEQFFKQLSDTEKSVIKLMNNSRMVEKIAEKLNKTVDEIITIGKSIEMKRKQFYEE